MYYMISNMSHFKNHRDNHMHLFSNLSKNIFHLQPVFLVETFYSQVFKVWLIDQPSRLMLLLFEMC